jgi:two-component sensor histidine kinase
MATPERPITVTVQGDGGLMPAGIATPLAVVLNELFQNAVDHAYPEGLALGATGAQVKVDIARDGDKSIEVLVADDGAGLPDGFDLESSTGLGLSIVRTLVTTELGGEISITNGDGPPDRPGTVVALSLPIQPPQVGTG